jgi:CRISPR-associated protein Cas1
MITKTIYIGNSCYLSKTNNQMVLDFKEKEKAQLPIEDIGCLILDHPQLTISSQLQLALLENKAIIITCDQNHLPKGLSLPIYAHTTHTETLISQLEAGIPLRKNIWASLIKQKITNQGLVLEYIHDKKNLLERYAKEVKSGDSGNVEAKAAAYYWTRIFPDLPYFLRDRAGEVPNNLLNFGYAILLSLVARFLVSSGLHPARGVFHKNKYNPFCLASDVMEPYRPFIDFKVYELFERFGKEVELTKSIKSELLALHHINVNINDRYSPLEIAVQKTCASVANNFKGLDNQLLLPRWEKS